MLLEEIDAPVITQNIDGLHRNLTTLVELHGSISKSKCYCCGAVIDGDATTHQNTKCPDCAVTGAYDPAIVLYGDDIDSTNLAKTEELLENADKIVVMGTRLHVNPIRSLVYEHASKVVFINDEPPNRQHWLCCRRHYHDILVTQLTNHTFHVIIVSDSERETRDERTQTKSI